MIKKDLQIPSPKTEPYIKRVAIFGSADVDPQHPLYEEAFNVARTLAYHDKLIVDGGGPGVMDAATKGAQAAGGKSLVVTFYPDDAPEFEGRLDDNTADEEIKTANYIERMFGLMENADIFICFQGGTGTLSEWATAWVLAHLYYGKHKPLILYGNFWHNLMRVINDSFFIGDKEKELYKIVSNEAELMEAMNEFEAEMKERYREAAISAKAREEQEAAQKEGHYHA